MNLFSLSKESVEAVEKGLIKLLKRAQPKSAFLFERSGYIIASKGEFPYLNPEDMGAVAAGATAALQSMVSITNSHELTITFHSPNIDKIHFAMVSNRIFLAVLYDTSTTSKKVRDAVKEFLKTITPYMKKNETSQITFNSIEFINDKLDELFKDALK